MNINESTLFQAEAKMLSLKADLSAVFDRRMEEKETRINQLTEELNGLRQRVSVYFMLHVTKYNRW